MIKIENVKFLSCNCCYSTENVSQISFINKNKNGICVSLCDKCRKELYEMLKGEFGSDKEWVSVNDRPPEPETTVLVWGGRSMYTAVCGNRGGYTNRWWKLNSKTHYCNPTHWMYLPDPPFVQTSAKL